MRSRLSLIGATLLALASAAEAKKATPHFHVLTEALQQRVAKGRPKQMAHNLDAVAIYKRKDGKTGGTGWLVSGPDAHGNALMITNHHVALFEKDSVTGDRFLFHPGGNTKQMVEAEVAHVVAANLDFDYALLRVKLPPSLRQLRPVVLANHFEFDGGIEVYNPSFPRMDEQEAFTPKRLQVGRTRAMVWEGLEEVRLPHRSGSSGSPVFSKQSHKLIGMMNAGDDAWLGLVRPIGRILAHLDQHLGKIADDKTRGEVDRLLANAAP